ncbi:MAG: hypothetical protein ACYDH3_00285 [Candidatus Aminicenantales bacterium]
MSDYPITVDVEMTLKASAVISGNETGTGIAIGPTGRARAYLFATAKVGSPTLDVHLEESDTLGSGYADIPGAAFEQVSAAGVKTIDFRATKKYVRYVAVLGGSTSVTAAMYVAQSPR